MFQTTEVRNLVLHLSSVIAVAPNGAETNFEEKHLYCLTSYLWAVTYPKAYMVLKVITLTVYYANTENGSPYNMHERT